MRSQINAEKCNSWSCYLDQQSHKANVGTNCWPRSDWCGIISVNWLQFNAFAIRSQFEICSLFWCEQLRSQGGLRKNVHLVCSVKRTEKMSIHWPDKSSTHNTQKAAKSTVHASAKKVLWPQWVVPALQSNDPAVRAVQPNARDLVHEMTQKKVEVTGGTYPIKVQSNGKVFLVLLWRASLQSHLFRVNVKHTVHFACTLSHDQLVCCLHSHHQQRAWTQTDQLPQFFSVRPSRTTDTMDVACHPSSMLFSLHRQAGTTRTVAIDSDCNFTMVTSWSGFCARNTCYVFYGFFFQHDLLSEQMAGSHISGFSPCTLRGCSNPILVTSPQLTHTPPPKEFLSLSFHQNLHSRTLLSAGSKFHNSISHSSGRKSNAFTLNRWSSSVCQGQTQRSFKYLQKIRNSGQKHLW